MAIKAIISKLFTKKNTLLISMLLSYAVFFLMRQNFSFLVSYIEVAKGLSKASIGTVMSASFLLFGIGKFVNGFITHLLSPKQFLFIGLVGTSLLNLIFPHCDSLLSLSIVWGLNALFQSIAWPQYVRLMKDWYSSTEIGTRWSILSVANQLGTILLLFWLDSIVSFADWEAGFRIPGIIGLVSSLIVLILPLNLRQEESHSTTNAPQAGSEKSNYKSILKEILTNKLLWFISFANLFLYVVKTGFCSWAPIYLEQAKALSFTDMRYSMKLFEVAGALGCLFAGPISDRIFNGGRGQVGVLYMLGLLLGLVMLWWAPEENYITILSSLLVIGFMMFGPQIMVGVASVDFSSKEAAVAANGFVSFSSYIGTAFFSGYLMGFIADGYGWGWVIGLLSLFCLAAIAFFAITWVSVHKTKKSQTIS